MKKRLLSSVAVSLVIVSVLSAFSLASCSKKEKAPDLKSLNTAAEQETKAETTARFATVTKSENDKAEKKNAETDIPKAAEGQTNAPVITGMVNTAPDQICISGTCDPNSVIYIKGGVSDTSYNSDGRYFIGTARIPQSGSTTLKVTAKSGDKTESPVVEVKGTYRASAKHIRDDVFEVIVGSDYQCHFVSALPDYEGTNLLTPSQKTNLTKTIKSNVEWLKNEMDGAELIYVFVPNPMTVYPETMPSEYKQYTGIGRTAEFTTCAQEGGAVVLDLTELFIKHKSDRYKLFNKTDSHWTEYGAWLAYTELMNYITKRFPDAKPRTEEEMGFYKKDFGGGDMAYYLELDMDKVREIAVFTDFKFTSPAKMNYYSEAYGFDTLLMNHNTTPAEATYTTGNTKLPNLYMMRDSFGIQLYNELPERCNKTTYKAMWSYTFDKNDIKKADADYVVYLVAERNITDLLY